MGIVLAIGTIVIALMALAQRRRWRRAIANPGRRRIRNHSTSARKLQRLLDSIIGNPRSAVLEALGPPPAVAAASTARSTWYYPMDLARRRAIAIDFEGDFARHAVVIDSPRGVRSD